MNKIKQEFELVLIKCIIYLQRFGEDQLISFGVCCREKLLLIKKNKGVFVIIFRIKIDYVEYL